MFSFPQRNTLLFVLALTTFMFSCAKKSTNQNIQNNCTIAKAAAAQVNFTILAGSGQFFPISIVGGYTYVSGYGVKGIIVYRLSQSQFMAYERSCTKDGCDVTKAQVWVQTGNTACKDSTCGSNFSIMDGSVQTGPATVPLYMYHTSWDGNSLRIYN